MEEVGRTKKEKRLFIKELKKEEKKRQNLRNKLKKYLTYFLVLAFLGWLGFKLYSFVSQPSSEVFSGSVDIAEGDWVKGDREAKVTLVEFGDFQCPACVSYYPILKKLLLEIPEGLKVVYLNFPLTQIHRNAFSAAKAAEAAGIQGKFWEMHDKLFEENGEWVDLGNPKEKFREFAREIGIDEEKFIIDYNSRNLDALINEDILRGSRLGVDATPTFFLNNKKIQPKSYEEFKKLVEEEIRGYSLE